ncbi:MAG TPA: sodium:solute symporter family protein, partial [Actinomycetota bacterium]|nr:sodium:solute symporter family protein [Actinomycetota bacterium]
MIPGVDPLLVVADVLLDMQAVDYLLLVIYFAFVLGIGWLVRRSVKSSYDFFLSGRSLPAWIAGLAFISANLGAIEILGFAANGAQYGMASVHYYWIGAIPAMVFLGIVMMPFYYGSKVRSVPEYLRLRYNRPTHLLNAVAFAVSAVLIAGVNLYSLAIVLRALLGWSLPVSVVVAAVFVLAYTVSGGLTGAVYNEVLQFFVIMAGLVPLTIVAIVAAGGPAGIVDRLADYPDYWLHPWSGTGFGAEEPNPIGDWVGIILGQAFVLSFGYWTTNFAEVQRAMSARNLSSARRAPIIGAYPKIFIPFLVIVPGICAALVVPGLGESPDRSYTNAIPLLMGQLLPSGVLGVAVTGLVAAFMAGMAANVSSFNAVFTYDIWQDYVRPGRPDHYYLKVGRVVTVLGVGVGILTAFIAAGYNNINEYLQTLFSFFQAPVFVTFILGMFWRRMTPWAGFWGLLSGTVAAAGVWVFGATSDVFRSSFQQAMWMGIVAASVDLIVSLVVSGVTTPKPESELVGLVKGLETKVAEAAAPWWRRPVPLGVGAITLAMAMYIPFLAGG